jgi:hypothetical protein
MARTAITGLLQIGWATVGRTVARVTAEHLDERRLDGLVAIRVDESLPPPRPERRKEPLTSAATSRPPRVVARR